MTSVDSTELAHEASTIIRNALAAVQNPNNALIENPDDIFHFDSLVRAVEQGLRTLRFFSTHQAGGAPLAPNGDAYLQSVEALEEELMKEFEKVFLGTGANSAEALVATSVHQVRQALVVWMSATYGDGSTHIHHGLSAARSLHAQGAHRPRAATALEDKMRRTNERNAFNRYAVEETQLRRNSLFRGGKVMPRPVGFTVRQQDVTMASEDVLRRSSDLAHEALARLRAYDASVSS
jgi:hypothetical protein